MNRIQPDNVHSSIFTPCEHQFELLWSCLQQNTISVLSSNSTKIFLASSLCKELYFIAAATAGPASDERCPVKAEKPRAVFLGNSYPCLQLLSESVRQNTDLCVVLLPEELEELEDWDDESWQHHTSGSQVVMAMCGAATRHSDRLHLQSANLLFLVDAQVCLVDEAFRQLVLSVPRHCRVVGCTPPLLSPLCSPASSTTPPHLLHCFLQRLTLATGCTVTTASDVAAVIGTESRAKEWVVACRKPPPVVADSVEAEVRLLLAQARSFLDNHRYDPVEVYGEEYREFCTGVPDPKKQPLSIFDNLESVLNDLGLWCSDRAALYALVEIEKLKKKTAYDRHYLLLCMVFTVLTRIRIVIEDCFNEYSELDQILQFSSPKVLRLITILRRIRPLHFVDPRNRNKHVADEQSGEGVADDPGSKLPEHELCEHCRTSLAETVDAPDSSRNPGVSPSGAEPVVVETMLENYNLDHIVKDASVTEVTDDDIARLQRQGWFDGPTQGVSDRDDQSACEVKEHCEDVSSDIGQIYSDVGHSTNNTEDQSRDLIDIVQKNFLNKHMKCRDIDLDSVDSFLSCTDQMNSLSLEDAKPRLSPKMNGFCKPESLHNFSGGSHIPGEDLCQYEEGLCVSKANQVLSDGCEKISSHSDDGATEHAGSDSVCPNFCDGAHYSDLSGCYDGAQYKSATCCGRGGASSTIACHGPTRAGVQSSTCNLSTGPDCICGVSACKGSVSSINNDPEPPFLNDTSDTSAPLLTHCANSSSSGCETPEIFSSCHGSPLKIAEPSRVARLASQSISTSCLNSKLDRNTFQCDSKMAVNDSFNESQCDASRDAVVFNNGKHSTRTTQATSSARVSFSLSGDPHDEDFSISSNHLISCASSSRDKYPDTYDEHDGVLSSETGVHDASSSEPASACDEIHAANVHVVVNTGEQTSLVNPEKSKDLDSEAVVSSETEIAAEQSHLKVCPRCFKINNEDKVSAESSSVKVTASSTLTYNQTIGNGQSASNVNGESVASADGHTVSNSCGQTSSNVGMAPTNYASLQQAYGRGCKKRRGEAEVKEKVKVHNPDDPDSVCGLIFVHSSTTAKMLYRLLKELSDIGGDFAWIFPQFTVEIGGDWKASGSSPPDEKTIENERKKQEEVLRRFRHLECNMLVATKVLEEGIDVPNCTLVVRFDPAQSFQSYVQSSGRARSSRWSHLFHLAEAEAADALVTHLATYSAYKKVILENCSKQLGDAVTLTPYFVSTCDVRNDPTSNHLISSHGETHDTVSESGHFDETRGFHSNRITTATLLTLETSFGFAKTETAQTFCPASTRNDLLVATGAENANASSGPGTTCVQTTLDVNDWPPYCTAAGAVLRVSSAMQLLNKYCAKLPSDTFTRLTVQWQIHSKRVTSENLKSSSQVITDELQELTVSSREYLTKANDVSPDRNSDTCSDVASELDSVMYCCSLALPINSPLKDIIVGPWQLSCDLAKHCAAFTACVALHQLGELDDYLLPVGKESIQLDQHLCPPPTSDLDPEAFPRPGTTKRRQYYYKKVAACLTSCTAVAAAAAVENSVSNIAPSVQGNEINKIESCSYNNAADGVPTEAVYNRIEAASVESKTVLGERLNAANTQYLDASPDSNKLNCLIKNEEIPGNNTQSTSTLDANTCCNEPIIDTAGIKLSSATTEKKPPGPTLRLYSISMVLRCAIPDQQNTRGRRIYRPEMSPRDFGILTTDHIPQTSAFPVFTRSGEVLVNLTLVATSLECDALKLTPEQLEQLNMFHQFTFSHVLRLEKYPIKFDPLKANASYFVVPLIRTPGNSNVDWQFIENIGRAGDLRPSAPSDDERRNFSFKKELYEDAVVMPWYRNHDQPQYFYVAEICDHLTPQSDFPDAGFETFEKYYLTKYGLQIRNLKQPLLDVDHTSARLNLLTPRHVNRKGVALPTTSEETKRAKRESLQQKQILVPELCSIHPFPASLWRKAVCLPTVLYRINSLLLADELRVTVAKEIGLGRPMLPSDHVWPALDFGWTLADVFKKCGEDDEGNKKSLPNISELDDVQREKLRPRDSTKSEDDLSMPDENSEKKRSRRKRHGELEIGMWSNDMAFEQQEMAEVEDEDLDELEVFDPNEDLPDNLTILDGGMNQDDDIEGELGADWGTGLKERKAKPRTGVSNVRKKAKGSMKSSSRSRDADGCTDDNGGGSIGIFRVGSPSNFECDDNFDFNDNCYKGDKFSSADGADMYSNYDEDEDFDDYWDDYDAYSDEESVAEENKNLNTSNEWNNKSKKRPEDEEPEDNQEELDLLMGEVQEEKIAHSEAEFRILIEKKKTEILQGVSFVREDDELLFEKARRKVDFESNNPSKEQEPCNEQPSSSCLEKSEKLEVEVINKTSDNNFTNDTSELTVAQRESSSSFGMDYSSLKQDATLENMMMSYVKKESTLYPVGEEKQLFSFDFQPDLSGHFGPSPSVILQALTMSNANDGVNLERLETIGDSYLKYAITTYLYCTFPQQHEGKLSYLRSKQVSNLNLYRLGKYKGLGECMVATKFEPHDNWLPPSYYVPRELEEALIASGIPSGHWNMAELPNLHELSSEQIRVLVLERSRLLKTAESTEAPCTTTPCWPPGSGQIDMRRPEELPIFIPYNLLTQHSIPDKSIADSVEALIGAYLTTCGPKGALLFMSWLGIKVLPCTSTLDPATGKEMITFAQVEIPESPLHVSKLVTPSELTYSSCTQINYNSGCNPSSLDEGKVDHYQNLQYPGVDSSTSRTNCSLVTNRKYQSPLFGCSTYVSYPVRLPDHERDLDLLLTGYEEFERTINYTFLDRAYLLQAFTHASFCRNRLTDCYQRLEFLGDAVLDYLITRHLYEDCRHHSPGALTDLRSALVNNTIFATLAVKHRFHKYFRHFSPGLDSVIRDFVRDQEANEHKINEEYYLLEGETEADIVEDIEVPKALGDVFESVAGAIFLDSGCSLDAVWGAYYPIMKGAIDQFTAVVPKSPIRELLEMEPETAKFGRPERLVDGKVRVSVEIFGKGSFCGVGRNYRIAKSTAAKRALRHLRRNLPAVSAVI
ncbi:Ribonuclease III domain [Trinorchestia longiramus]|nr:Ribonuclease III domain [Trinorchestia longiramus]